MKKLLVIGLLGLMTAGAASTVSAESKTSTVSIEFVANDAIENLVTATKNDNETMVQLPHENMHVQARAASNTPLTIKNQSTATLNETDTNEYMYHHDTEHVNVSKTAIELPMTTDQFTIDPHTETAIQYTFIMAP